MSRIWDALQKVEKLRDVEGVATLPLPDRKKTLKQIEQIGLVANRSQTLCSSYL